MTRPPPISMRCWPCFPGSSPPRWRSRPLPRCAARAMMAARYYETVWRTDHSYVSAAFGLARQRCTPETGPVRSRHSTRCPRIQRISPPPAATAIEILLDGRTPEKPGRADAARCRQARRGTEPGIGRQARNDSAAGARRGVGLAAGGTQRPSAARLLGAAFDERGIRTGMERCYRELAHETTDMWERIALVEQANEIRPRTRV